MRTLFLLVDKKMLGHRYKHCSPVICSVKLLTSLLIQFDTGDIAVAFQLFKSSSDWSPALFNLLLQPQVPHPQFRLQRTAIPYQLFISQDSRRKNLSISLLRLIPILGILLVLRNAALKNLLAISLKSGHCCIPACMCSYCICCLCSQAELWV